MKLLSTTLCILLGLFYALCVTGFTINTEIIHLYKLHNRRPTNRVPERQNVTRPPGVIRAPCLPPNRMDHRYQCRAPF